MADRLKGKGAIVTGAASGIGKEIVRQFIAEGARVAIGDVNEATAQQAAHELGDACRAFVCDVSSETSVAAATESAAQWLGRIDILVNNAGIQIAGAVTDFKLADWDQVMAVNVGGCFLTTKYAIPHLEKAGGGSIILTSSVAGQRGAPGVTAYSASKGAVMGYGTALALELAPSDIRVNTVCPGWVDTPFNGPVIAAMGGKDVQERLIAETVPLRRQGTPADIAPMYVFLASDEARFITAKVYGVDGGAYT
jgi:NAD(P)-dependent dehydrogenase (short-subunit alcohol dehydrogenase family)